MIFPPLTPSSQFYGYHPTNRNTEQNIPLQPKQIQCLNDLLCKNVSWQITPHISMQESLAGLIKSIAQEAISRNNLPIFLLTGSSAEHVVQENTPTAPRIELTITGCYELDGLIACLKEFTGIGKEQELKEALQFHQEENYTRLVFTIKDHQETKKIILTLCTMQNASFCDANALGIHLFQNTIQSTDPAVSVKSALVDAQSKVIQADQNTLYTYPLGFLELTSRLLEGYTAKQEHIWIVTDALYNTSSHQNLRENFFDEMLQFLDSHYPNDPDRQIQFLDLFQKLAQDFKSLSVKELKARILEQKEKELQEKLEQERQQKEKELIKESNIEKRDLLPAKSIVGEPLGEEIVHSHCPSQKKQEGHFLISVENHIGNGVKHEEKRLKASSKFKERGYLRRDNAEGRETQASPQPQIPVRTHFSTTKAHGEKSATQVSEQVLFAKDISGQVLREQNNQEIKLNADSSERSLSEESTRKEKKRRRPQGLPPPPKVAVSSILIPNIEKPKQAPLAKQEKPVPISLEQIHCGREIVGSKYPINEKIQRLLTLSPERGAALWKEIFPAQEFRFDPQLGHYRRIYAWMSLPISHSPNFATLEKQLYFINTLKQELFPIALQEAGLDTEIADSGSKKRLSLLFAYMDEPKIATDWIIRELFPHIILPRDDKNPKATIAAKLYADSRYKGEVYAYIQQSSDLEFLNLFFAAIPVSCLDDKLKQLAKEKQGVIIGIEKMIGQTVQNTQDAEFVLEKLLQSATERFKPLLDYLEAKKRGVIYSQEEELIFEKLLQDTKEEFRSLLTYLEKEKISSAYPMYERLLCLAPLVQDHICARLASDFQNPKARLQIGLYITPLLSNQAVYKLVVEQLEIGLQGSLQSVFITLFLGIKDAIKLEDKQKIAKLIALNGATAQDLAVIFAEMQDYQGLQNVIAYPRIKDKTTFIESVRKRLTSSSIYGKFLENIVHHTLASTDLDHQRGVLAILAREAKSVSEVFFTENKKELFNACYKHQFRGSETLLAKVCCFSPEENESLKVLCNTLVEEKKVSLERCRLGYILIALTKPSQDVAIALHEKIQKLAPSEEKAALFRSSFYLLKENYNNVFAQHPRLLSSIDEVFRYTKKVIEKKAQSSAYIDDEVLFLFAMLQEASDNRGIISHKDLIRLIKETTTISSKISPGRIPEFCLQYCSWVESVFTHQTIPENIRVFLVCEAIETINRSLQSVSSLSPEDALKAGRDLKTCYDRLWQRYKAFDLHAYAQLPAGHDNLHFSSIASQNFAVVLNIVSQLMVKAGVQDDPWCIQAAENLYSKLFAEEKDRVVSHQGLEIEIMDEARLKFIHWYWEPIVTRVLHELLKKGFVNTNLSDQIKKALHIKEDKRAQVRMDVISLLMKAYYSDTEKYKECLFITIRTGTSLKDLQRNEHSTLNKAFLHIADATYNSYLESIHTKDSIYARAALAGLNVLFQMGAELNYQVRPQIGHPFSFQMGDLRANPSQTATLPSLRTALANINCLELGPFLEQIADCHLTAGTSVEREYYFSYIVISSLILLARLSPKHDCDRPILLLKVLRSFNHLLEQAIEGGILYQCTKDSLLLYSIKNENLTSTPIEDLARMTATNQILGIDYATAIEKMLSVYEIEPFDEAKKELEKVIANGNLLSNSQGLQEKIKKSIK